jgi:hypothetical protein
LRLSHRNRRAAFGAAAEWMNFLHSPRGRCPSRMFVAGVIRVERLLLWF